VLESACPSAVIRRSGGDRNPTDGTHRGFSMFDGVSSAVTYHDGLALESR